MDLLNLNIGADSLEVIPHWKFSKNGILIITDSHGRESYFGKIQTSFKAPRSTNGELACGFLKDDGTLVKDKNRACNTDRFALLISAVGGMIHLPIMNGNRIKISPILKKDRSMSAAIIYIFKGEILDIRIDGLHPRTVHLEYSQVDQKLHASYSPTFRERRIHQLTPLARICKKIKTITWNYFHPHRPWRT